MLLRVVSWEMAAPAHTQLWCWLRQVRTNKPYLKYSNVRMSDGSSWTGNTVVSVTATEFKVRLSRNLPCVKTKAAGLPQMRAA